MDRGMNLSAIRDHRSQEAPSQTISSSLYSRPGDASGQIITIVLAVIKCLKRPDQRRIWASGDAQAREVDFFVITVDLCYIVWCIYGNAKIFGILRVNEVPFRMTFADEV